MDQKPYHHISYDQSENIKIIWDTFAILCDIYDVPLYIQEEQTICPYKLPMLLP